MSTPPLATEPAASRLGDGHATTDRSGELVRTGAVAAVCGAAMLAARAADATGALRAGVRGAVLARADVGAVVLLVLGVALAVAPAVRRLLAGRPPASWRRHFVTWLLPLYALWIPVVVIDAVVVHPTASWRAWLASIVLFRDPRGAPVPGLGIGPVLTVLAVTIVLVPVAERLLRRAPDGARVTPSGLLRGAALLAAVGLVVRAVLVVGGATTPFGALSWWPAHLDAVAGGIAVATLRTAGWAAAPRRRLGAAALAAAVLALAVIVLPRTLLVTDAGDAWLRGTLYAVVASATVLAVGAAGRPAGAIARSVAVVAPGIVLTGDIAFITIARQHVEAVVDGPAGLRLSAPALPAWAWSLTIAAAIGVLLTAAVIVPLRRARIGRWPAHGYPLAAATVVAGALLVRVTTWLTIAPVKTDGGDPFFYHVTANLLAAGRGFLEPHNFLDGERQIASAVHAPLYPVVLSLSSRLGGTTYVDHKFASIVIGSGVVLLTVLLADRLAGHAAAIVAGSLAAVYPNLWLIDSLLFPEGLFALLTTACILVAYVWWDRPVWWLAVALGALIGLAALTRGEGLLLGPLLAAPWILMRRPLALADRVRQLALAGAACLVVIAPWTIRNLATFDVFVPLSTNGNELIMYANCDDTYSGRLIGFWSFACQERYRQEIGEPPGDEAEKAQFWRQVGVDYARDHLGDVPRVVAARVLRQWELFRPGQTVEFAAIENRDKPSTAVGLGMYYALLAASIGGAVVLRRRRVRLLPLLAQVVSVTITAAYAYGTVRFRAPVEPVLCVLAGVLVSALVAAADIDRTRAATRTGRRRLMATLSRRARTALAVTVLALLAYVPALLSSPGRMPADTKLSLYLDPGRLISDAPWTFDARQFAGWVPHQMIAYLWPQGPWYWVADGIGLPDWVAQRLWIGTLFLVAGTGVLWMARRLGLSLLAALAAALVYQLTPYLLPYVSRTSAMLLPWAGLGWLVGLTALAATRTRWRHAALAALVVVTTGSINPTALAMIAPGPVLWLAFAAGRRLITWRRATTTALTIGGLSLAVSAWWVTMVAIQGRKGADVLAYSESLESVSFTSTSTEVWRNLGYWLTYIRDAYDATTTAGRDYMVSGRLIATGFVLLLVAVAGLVATRWAHRAFAVSLVATGVLLGVGVHPIDDPSPLMDALLGDGTSGAALALRSSTRAVPLLVLGLALGAACLVDALGSLPFARPRSWRPLAAVAVGLLAIANLPSLTGRRLVDPAIDRDQDVPAAWTDAVAALDADLAAGRVLQLPGQEFGAFRWGYTVDPPLPGLTDRPLVTRDLLPLGSAAAMDLVYALDDRFQSGTIEPASIATVARLLGAGTIWVTGDAAFDRFRTPRPELVHDLFADVPGVGSAVPYGEPVVNRPDIPMTDEQSVSDPRVGQPVPPVELAAVEDPVAVIRAKDDVVVLVGSGDGIVDAAAAGLLDGSELVRYSGSLAADEVAPVTAAASTVIVTDSNRDRAHHWRSSQDVVGLTEDDDPAPDVLHVDPADERLPVFGTTGAPATVAVQEGPVRAHATTYGEPFAYRPEDRPVMAIDGDPTTAWVVGDRADPRGEQIRLDVDAPIDHVTLVQPAGAADQRHLTRVSVAVDDREPVVVDLDEPSLSPAGQRVDVEPTSDRSSVTITILDVTSPTAVLGPALAAVGFAEIDAGLGPTVEVVRPPADAADVLAAAPNTPVSFVLSRLRTRPTDRWRADPEPTLRRDIDLPTGRTFDPAITVRLDQRASDDVLADLLGVDGPRATDRLTGVAGAAGWAATDGDVTTSWQTPFAGAVGTSLDLVSPSDLTTFTITQPGGDHSPITGVLLTSGSTVVDAPVGPPDAGGTSVVALPAALPAGPLRVEITTIDARSTLDRRYAEPVVLPAAIAEISIGEPATVPAQLDTGCRDDLVTVDGVAVPVRVAGDVADLLAGEALEAEPCAGPLELAAGTHRVATTPGSATGLDVDRVVLADAERPAAAPSAGSSPEVTVRASGRTSRDVTVDGCPAGCWLVLGEGFHPSWSASTEAGDLGPSQLVDGGFNGWWIAPTDHPVDVAIRWTAQRPLTLALWFSVLGAIACLALIVLDRRRAPVLAPLPPRLALDTRPVPWRSRWIASALWVGASGLLVGFGWALVAAVAAAVVVVALGRPRLAGVLTMGILAVMGLVVVRVVQTERPWPDAGWPARFEWLHALGGFAAVSLLVTIVTGRQRDAPPPPTDP